MKDQKHYLDKILRDVVPIGVYRGVLVEKLIGGWKVFGQTVVSAEEVDRVIDESLKGLKNSLKSGETGIISTLG